MPPNALVFSAQKGNTNAFGLRGENGRSAPFPRDGHAVRWQTQDHFAPVLCAK